MQTLRIDHPDIEKFISIKTGDVDMVKYSNISVLLTHEFMEAVKNDTKFDLHYEGELYDTIRAKNLMYSKLRNYVISLRIRQNICI